MSNFWNSWKCVAPTYLYEIPEGNKIYQFIEYPIFLFTGVDDSRLGLDRTKYVKLDEYIQIQNIRTNEEYNQVVERVRNLKRMEEDGTTERRGFVSFEEERKRNINRVFDEVSIGSGVSVQSCHTHKSHTHASERYMDTRSERSHQSYVSERPVDTRSERSHHTHTHQSERPVDTRSERSHHTHTHQSERPVDTRSERSHHTYASEKPVDTRSERSHHTQSHHTHTHASERSQSPSDDSKSEFSVLTRTQRASSRGISIERTGLARMPTIPEGTQSQSEQTQLAVVHHKPISSGQTPTSAQVVVKNKYDTYKSISSGKKITIHEEHPDGLKRTIIIT